MALNKFMHPRNIYKKPPNFKQLTVEFPEFRKHVIQEVSGKVTIDFKNADSLRALTKTLLKKDFGLDVDMPLDRLIPTVPLRVNYILWLEDILHDSGLETDQIIKGIDIGTGASCVYPLLGCKMNNWQFLATDVDEENLLYAQRNVEKNGLSEMITVEKVPANSILEEVLTNMLHSYDFCMCNPPFFADHMEAQGLMSRSDERSEPHSSSTASCVEQIAEGGEVAFVRKMIHESLKFKDKIRIFTSMLGKKSSIVPLKNELRSLTVANFGSTEFCQGKTMRWGIGWSFDTSTSFPKSAFQEKKKDKPPLTYEIPQSGELESCNLQSVCKVVMGHLEKLQIIYETLKSSDKNILLSLCAKQNTWSNMRRKRREFKKRELLMKVKSRETTQRSGEDNPVKGDNSNQNIDTGTPRSLVCENEQIGDSFVKGKRKLEAEDCGTDTKNKKHCLENNTGETSSADQSSETVSCNTKSAAVTMLASSQKNEQEDLNIVTCKALPNDEVGNTTNVNNTNDFIFKCKLKLCERESGHVTIEMSWIEGQNRESMHQVLQYIKNQFKNSSCLDDKA